jgi:hypothetical protein
MAVPAAGAFSTANMPIYVPSSRTNTNTQFTTTSLAASTLEERATNPPTREAPNAGWVPEWEDRPGLTTAEFMESDMSKPDLSGMWECPLTRWDSEGYVGISSSVVVQRPPIVTILRQFL